LELDDYNRNFEKAIYKKFTLSKINKNKNLILKNFVSYYILSSDEYMRKNYQ
jgi:hypothetical protein